MKVLLAEDEPISRTMLEHWARGWGYEPVLVRDGDEALVALQSDPEIQLAVVDWVMPKRDGVEVCNAVRSAGHEPYVYMILLTGRDQKADIVRGLEAGADDYIVKPCNPVELELRLRTGRRIIELQRELVHAREALRVEALQDALTGLLNRRAMMQALTSEVARAARTQMHLCVFSVDLDHFKHINDTWGHAAGDAVLREAAQRMRSGIRAYDTLGRTGGEEFMVLVPDCDVRLGAIVAERVRRLVADGPVAYGAERIPVTCSVGVAGTDLSPRTDNDALVRASDAALYRAKRAGRDRVVVAIAADWPDAVRKGEPSRIPAA
ncbi:MAG TPA: diguanylate cyclase [Polyangiaceae bacterium]